MTSQKQMEANRRNALKSTGPKTSAGKAQVSMNAVKHGLRAQRIVIEGESQQEFNDFCSLLVEQMSPENPLETLLVDRIAEGFWRLRRAGRVEAQIFNEMRDALIIDRNKDTDKSFISTIDRDKIGFPSRGWFKTCQEAVNAWHVVQAGWPSDPSYPFPFESFEDFVKNAARPLPEVSPTASEDLISFITKMQNANRSDYELYSRLAELKRNLSDIAGGPKSLLHIPAFRQYLQDIRQLVSGSEKIVEKYGDAMDDAIRDVSYYEKTINEQLQPDTGQSVAHDLKGSSVLNKFNRYESQIERSLYKAMHELQRMQALRLGRESSVPVAVDIDI